MCSLATLMACGGSVCDALLGRSSHIPRWLIPSEQAESHLKSRVDQKQQNHAPHGYGKTSHDRTRNPAQAISHKSYELSIEPRPGKMNIAPRQAQYETQVYSMSTNVRAYIIASVSPGTPPIWERYANSRCCDLLLWSVACGRAGSQGFQVGTSLGWYKPFLGLLQR